MKTDKNLFIYLTKSSGHTLQDAADAMGLSLSGLSRRLNGHVDFTVAEMAAWMRLTGVGDAGPVFFPEVVADMQLSGARNNG